VPAPEASRARARYTLAGMRRFFTLRWLGLHAAMVVIFAGFLALGWWQLRRAEGGNALSWGYTFEWPLFAGFVVFFWVKMMRDELQEAREAAADAEDPVTASEEQQLTLPAGARPRRSPPETGLADPQGSDDEQDEELAAYNAYLAQLNAEAGRGPGRFSGLGARRHAAAWRARPEPPSAPPVGDLEV
jgi:hypothetical protein